MAFEIARQRVGHGRGLADDLDAGGQGLGEQVGDDLIMGAAQDGLVRVAADAAAQRVDVVVNHHLQLLGRGAQFDQAGQAGAGLGEDGEVVAALVDLDLIDPAHGRGGGAEDAGDVDGLLLLAFQPPVALGLVGPGQAGGRLDGRDDDAQDVDRTAQRLAHPRDPGLLQPAQGDGRGRVAGQDHERGARRE
ncbi:hypothetical protein D3C77_359070 [compost metagenome]